MLLILDENLTDYFKLYLTMLIEGLICLIFIMTKIDNLLENKIYLMIIIGDNDLSLSN
jgi:hypothetical protein